LRLSRLLESLKLMSRVSRSGLNAVDVDLSGVCQAIGAQLADKYPDRQVALEIAPGMVCVGDPQLLTVAMAALLDNAWKFTARKPQAWISVSLSHVTQPGEQVVCVADNGTGFDEAYAHKLFGNFQRLHSSADFPGTGLGLAIVRRIVTRHGGRVWAESTAAGGASFYIALPTATLLG
jgi:light-regulated signal transduction histidine kinase (bacteriophytochrome)